MTANDRTWAHVDFREDVDWDGQLTPGQVIYTTGIDTLTTWGQDMATAAPGRSKKMEHACDFGAYTLAKNVDQADLILNINGRVPDFYIYNLLLLARLAKLHGKPPVVGHLHIGGVTTNRQLCDGKHHVYYYKDVQTTNIRFADGGSWTFHRGKMSFRPNYDESGDRVDGIARMFNMDPALVCMPSPDINVRVFGTFTVPGAKAGPYHHNVMAELKSLGRSETMLAKAMHNASICWLHERLRGKMTEYNNLRRDLASVRTELRTRCSSARGLAADIATLNALRSKVNSSMARDRLVGIIRDGNGAIAAIKEYAHSGNITAKKILETRNVLEGELKKANKDLNLAKYDQAIAKLKAMRKGGLLLGFGPVSEHEYRLVLPSMNVLGTNHKQVKKSSEALKHLGECSTCSSATWELKLGAIAISIHNSMTCDVQGCLGIKFMPLEVQSDYWSHPHARANCCRPCLHTYSSEILEYMRRGLHAELAHLLTHYLSSVNPHSYLTSPAFLSLRVDAGGNYIQPELRQAQALMCTVKMGV